MQSVKVIKANQIVEAGYELTTNEQRLILAVITRIPSKQEIDPKVMYEITAQEFAEQYNIHPKTAYRELREATSRLYERSINIKTEAKTIKVRWASMVILDNPYFPDVLADENWKRVVIGFSPQIIPYLSNLKANFTQYLLSDISNVSGAYTIRFYELIRQYQSVGKREISIKDLRFMLNLDDKYPLFADLRKRVIEPSIKEINEKTPLKVKYELKKSGKTVSHIALTFSEKQKTIKNKGTNLERDPNTVDMFSGKTDEEAKGLPSWQTKGLTDAQIKKLAVYMKEFVDANSSKISPNDRRDYKPIFEDWKTLLKDPKHVMSFNKIEVLLERS